ncbi:cytochrome P450 [Setomelanomma holmii]|uniref:Cytochrome P450 n=1 Tax=Setomelanomma holmii TaxID=210430 RepID=A0A9P4GWN1_9PLEO|nr:cytochrome P450 [Setomelanomma holmii]
MTVTRGFVTLVVFVLTVVISKVAYDTYFHPLARYPGPPLSCVTDAVYWYHWLRGNLPFYIARVHARYGTQVRLSPNRLSFIEPEAWQDIHGRKSSGRKVKLIKDPRMYLTGPSMQEPSLLTEPDDERHRKMRKIFAPGFSDRALKAQEDLIRAHVDKLVSVLSREAKTGRRIDIVRFYNCTTFDIIGELAFGESLGLLDNSQLNDWVKSILYSFERLAFYALLLEYRILGYIAHFFLSKNLKKASAKNVAYTADRVRKRMDRGTVTNKADFWTLVLSEHESGSVSLEQMKSNAYLFVAAGSETTATMLSGLTYNLLMNPTKMKRVVDEIRSMITKEDDLTIENIQRLKYLDACFSESMRSRMTTTIALLHV